MRIHIALLETWHRAAAVCWHCPIFLTKQMFDITWKIGGILCEMFRTETDRLNGTKIKQAEATQIPISDTQTRGSFAI